MPPFVREEKEQFNTKYLLMQIEPNRDYSFEITKNVKIPAGEYDCTLEAKGPQGVLAEESRKVSLANPWQESVFEQVPWPVELDEKVSGQKDEEERPKEESNLQREISSDATEKEDPCREGRQGERIHQCWRLFAGIFDYA